MSGAFNWLPGGENMPDESARDAVEQNEQMMQAAIVMQREEARLFYDVFMTGRGPELLQLLREKTIEVDLMQVSAVIGNGLREMGVNPSEWAYHRNGQNTVIRYIETMVRTAALIEAEEKDNV